MNHLNNGILPRPKIQSLGHFCACIIPHINYCKPLLTQTQRVGARKVGESAAVERTGLKTTGGFRKGWVDTDGRY